MSFSYKSHSNFDLRCPTLKIKVLIHGNLNMFHNKNGISNCFSTQTFGQNLSIELGPCRLVPPQILLLLQILLQTRPLILLQPLPQIQPQTRLRLLRRSLRVKSCSRRRWACRCAKGISYVEFARLPFGFGSYFGKFVQNAGANPAKT